LGKKQSGSDGKEYETDKKSKSIESKVQNADPYHPDIAESAFGDVAHYEGRGHLRPWGHEVLLEGGHRRGQNEAA